MCLCGKYFFQNENHPSNSEGFFITDFYSGGLTALNINELRNLWLRGTCIEIERATLNSSQNEKQFKPEHLHADATVCRSDKDLNHQWKY